MSAATPGWLLPLLDRRLLVLCGAGGVGKTTASAAIALEAAVRGRRVLVMTIDPAQRLAESLGLRGLGNEETLVDLGARLPGEQVRGSLRAMMLDTRAAFEELLDRAATTQEEVARVHDNPLFRLMLEQMAGVQDYLAGEKVYDTVSSGRYDLVVLDTPPTSNALDFLDAPGHLARLLDERIIRWFIPGLLDSKDARPGIIRRLLSTSTNVVKRILSRVFGRQLIDEVEAFLTAWASMRAEVRRRSLGVQELMKSPDTAFLLITATSDLGLRDVLFFHQQILERDLPFGGFVINRVHPKVPPEAADQKLRPSLIEEAGSYLEASQERAWEDDGLESLMCALQDNIHLMNRLAEQDSRLIERLLSRASCEVEPLLIPFIPEEVYDVQALRRIAGYLVPCPASTSPVYGDE